MSRIFEIAEEYVDELASLDPNFATSIGVSGHETELSDFSPEGHGHIADLNRRTLSAAESAPVDGEADRIARDVMLERMQVRRDLYEAGEYMRDVRIIGSGMGALRSVFDQMPRATEHDWRNIAGRLANLPQALTRYRSSLQEGLAQSKVAAQRQAQECAKQAETWCGLKTDTPSFFSTLIDAFDGSGIAANGLRADLERGVRGAEAAYAELRSFLLDEYLPKADARDACGRERYALNSRVFNGAELDLDDTYRWGWEELYRVEKELAKTADRIKPGATVAEALEILESDPARQISSVQEFQSWLQELHDRALDDLDGTHFDIDPRIKRVEVLIPPPGGALAPYYTGPSEDFTRPGRTWWPLGSRKTFPKWFQVTTAYHEGVPGHHLQVGATRCFADRLSRYQRTAAFVSGHGEGWALYAERLMGELGYLENPDYYLGMLSAQAMRCVRVIVDIGMHLELPIPKGERFHPGEVWNHDLALEFAVERALQPREFMASEIIRYLGWAAQAISYKVGERYWLNAREAAKKRVGASFDLKAFHTKALMLGPMGLAQLERELA
jgi:uncharacterized protein (DUF885 family)